MPFTQSGHRALYTSLKRASGDALSADEYLSMLPTGEKLTSTLRNLFTDPRTAPLAQAGVGTVLGGTAGALASKKNRLRNGLLGALAGSVAGAGTGLYTASHANPSFANPVEVKASDDDDYLLPGLRKSTLGRMLLGPTPREEVRARLDELNDPSQARRVMGMLGQPVAQESLFPDVADARLKRYLGARASLAAEGPARDRAVKTLMETIGGPAKSWTPEQVDKFFGDGGVNTGAYASTAYGVPAFHDLPGIVTGVAKNMAPGVGTTLIPLPAGNAENPNVGAIIDTLKADQLDGLEDPGQLATALKGLSAASRDGKGSTIERLLKASPEDIKQWGLTPEEVKRIQHVGAERLKFIESKLGRLMASNDSTHGRNIV